MTARWFRRPWLVGGVALLVGLVAGGGIAAAVLCPEAGPRIGTLLPAADGEVDEAAAITVELPAGSVTFSVSNPVDEVAPAPEIDTAREAGAGTSLLGLGLSVELGARRPLAYSLPAADPGIVASAALVVGGSRIDLGDLWKPGVPALPTEGFLVVPGETDQVSLDDLVLEVNYDGLVQSVNAGTGEGDRGVAAPLYDEGGLPRAPTFEPVCSAPETLDPATTGLQMTGTCDLVGAVLTPYLPSMGWAQPNRTWVVVQLWVYVYLHWYLGPDPEDGYVAYGLTSAAQSFTLDGQRQATVLDFGIESQRTLTTMAFQVPAADAPLELTMSGFYSGAPIGADPYTASAGLPALITVPFDLAFALPISE